MRAISAPIRRAPSRNACSSSSADTARPRGPRRPRPEADGGRHRRRPRDRRRSTGRRPGEHQHGHPRGHSAPSIVPAPPWAHHDVALGQDLLLGDEAPNDHPVGDRAQGIGIVPGGSTVTMRSSTSACRAAMTTWNNSSCRSRSSPSSRTPSGGRSGRPVATRERRSEPPRSPNGTAALGRSGRSPRSAGRAGRDRGRGGGRARPSGPAPVRWPASGVR